MDMSTAPEPAEVLVPGAASADRLSGSDKDDTADEATAADQINGCSPSSPQSPRSSEEEKRIEVQEAPELSKDTQAAPQSQVQLYKLLRQDSVPSLVSGSAASELAPEKPRPRPFANRRNSRVSQDSDLTCMLQSLIANGQQLQSMLQADAHQALNMVSALEQNVSMLRSENAILRRALASMTPQGLSEHNAQTGLGGAQPSRAEAEKRLEPILSESLFKGSASFTPGIQRQISSLSQNASGSAKPSGPVRRKNRLNTDPSMIRSVRDVFGSKGPLQQTSPFKRDQPSGNSNRAKESANGLSGNRPVFAPSVQVLEARESPESKESSKSRPGSVIQRDDGKAPSSEIPLIQRDNDKADSCDTGRSVLTETVNGRESNFPIIRDTVKGRDTTASKFSMLVPQDEPEHLERAGRKPPGGDRYMSSYGEVKEGKGQSKYRSSKGRSDQSSSAGGRTMASLLKPMKRFSGMSSSTVRTGWSEEDTRKRQMTTGRGPSAMPRWLSQLSSNFKITDKSASFRQPDEFESSLALCMNEELEEDPSNFYEFHLLDVWAHGQEESGHSHHGLHRQKGLLMLQRSCTHGALTDHHEREEREEVHKAPFFMIRPTSALRIIWDMLSALLIGYDGVMTPMMLFDLEKNGFTTVATWIVRVFWTMDIPMTLMTGFTRFDGDLEMRPRRVLLRYLKTWAFPDALVVSSDWVEVFMQTEDYASGGGSAARLSKAIRIMRVIRMVRLLRVGRLPIIMERLSVHIPMQVNFIIRAAASVLKIMGIILLLAHSIACFWYFTADSGPRDNNWILANDMQDSSTIYLYLTAFHWSLTQFSGSMEVAPTNEVERFLAVVTLLFSFMVSNVFVSSLTSSMTRFHMVSSRQTKMFAELRRYLERNHISNKLAIRLNIHATHVFKEQQRNTDEHDIEMLQYVSDALLTDLHYEIYSRWVAFHPFFEKCSAERPQLMRRICHQATKMHRFMQGDVIFSAGEAPEPPMMFVIVAGTVHYHPDQEKVEEDLDFGDGEEMGRRLTDAAMEAKMSAMQEELEIQHGPGSHFLSEGCWMCEGPLWVAWTYLGDLRAVDTAQLMTLEGEALHRVVERYDELPLMSAYAAAYKDVLSRVPAFKMSDIGSNTLASQALKKVDFGENESIRS